MSRATLKPIVSKLREAIIKGVAGKLEKYGFDENGKLVVEKPLSEYDETIRDNLVALFEAKEINTQEKYVDYIHNTSRTFMHILICFKLMEKRGIMGSLLERVIGTDIYNEIIPDFASVNPMAFDEFIEMYSREIESLAVLDNEKDDIEYYQFLYLMKSLSNEMAMDVPLLFMEYEYNLVHPDYNDLKDILRKSGEISVAEYAEDDFLGWIYQYWVDTDDTEIVVSSNECDVSYANKIYYDVLILLDKEQTEYGEFYTPRWVVKYIVDNVVEEYRRNNDVSIENIKILDPACGAGNFLVYAFDAFVNIYREEHNDWKIKDIIESVLAKNIFGADIQREPLQITALNLWIKAKSYAVNANISNLNLVNVNILKANSLYKWETEEEYHQMSLFDTPDSITERKYTSEDIGRLLSNQSFQEHNSAVRFFREKFEIIIMNPPFVDARKMNSETKLFLAQYYPDNSRNLFSAFIQRAFELSKRTGVIGFVSSDTWMTITSFEKIRNMILENSLICKCLHLGFGVFDGADVSGVIFLLNKKKNSKVLSKFYDSRLLETKGEENSNVYSFCQNEFKSIAGTPFIYEISPNMRKAFEKSVALGNGMIADIYSGIQVKMTNGYVYKRWEVPQDEKYASFAYDCVGKYSSELNYVIDWSKESVDRLKRESKDKGYHHSVLISSNAEKYLFRKGILYSAGGSRFYSRIMDDNTIFYVGESAVFVNDNTIPDEYVLGLLNSRIVDYILNLLNPSKNFQVGDISRIPFIYPNTGEKDAVVKLVKDIIDIQKEMFSYTYKSVEYKMGEIAYGFKQGADSILDAYNIYVSRYSTLQEQIYEKQNILDELFFNIYGLDDNERASVCSKFSNNINQFNKPATMEEAVIHYIRDIVKEKIRSSHFIYTEEDILVILGKYFDDVFGKESGYKRIEESEVALQKRLLECIRNGIKVGAKSVVFSGDLDSMEEPFLVSKKLAGRGNTKVNVYWYRTDFLIDFLLEKRYAMQNEIRRLTNEVYLPKLQRAKAKLQVEGLSASDKKNIQKEVSLYEECVKTLENWKVVD